MLILLQYHMQINHQIYQSQPDYIYPKTLDGVGLAPALFQSAHIEGRGRYWDRKTGTGYFSLGISSPDPTFAITEC